MTLLKRITFTVIYCSIGTYLIYGTAMPPELVVLLAILVSGFAAKRGVFAGLEHFLKS